MAKIVAKNDEMKVTVGQEEKKVPVSIAQVELEETTTAETLLAALVELAGKTNVRAETDYGKVVALINYAADLKIRAQERQAFLAANQGPEKAVEKVANAAGGALKALIAAGMSEEDAKKFLREQLSL